jgi:hypothetical protein
MNIELDVSIKDLVTEKSSVPDFNQPVRADRARRLMTTIRQSAGVMAGIQGRRKAMLLIGEGIDYNIDDAVGGGREAADSIRQLARDAIAAASRANVSIYALDPRGLRPGWKNSYRTALSMSGVALSSIAANSAWTVKPQDGGSSPSNPPTAVREFDRNDAVTIFAELYESVRAATAHRLDLKAQWRTEDGQIVREVTESGSSTDLQSANGGYTFSTTFPLSTFTPGRYVIHVEGQAQIGDRETVSRDIAVRIR